MSLTTLPVPVVDLFAGPGGLGEGFSCVRYKKRHGFKICLSIEKDNFAWQTLRLRSFFRQFSGRKVPDAYYAFIRGEIKEPELFASYPSETAAAEQEAWCAEMGHPDLPNTQIDTRIRNALGGAQRWVLIGGPPCQAYSTVGRSRLSKLRKDDLKAFEANEKHHLYKQYLRILAVHHPPVFVMENVKGLLSSKIGGELIVEKIISDLREPPAAVNVKSSGVSYRLYSFTKESRNKLFPEDPMFEPADFMIRAEDFGIPQARHRLIILGVRSDIRVSRKLLTASESGVGLDEVLFDLPRLGSDASAAARDPATWATALKKAETLLNDPDLDAQTKKEMESTLRFLNKDLTVGGVFLPYLPGRPNKLTRRWYRDRRMSGVRNHETRRHMTSDLHRYLFAACFATVHNRSPILADFPATLLPAHSNVQRGIDEKVFADRFRVQLKIKEKPATTITSHIAKDGHYFIHPDPAQCRSFTVREAARVQTFPDNYIFLGTKTSQYQQVGNAVPPLLAHKLAKVVLDLLLRWE